MSNADRIIQVAKAEVGYREGRSNKQKYSPAVPSLEWSQNQPWCATFVSWCAQQASVKTLYPVTASTDAGAAWFKRNGQWSEYPAVGAQIFFGVNGDMNHTGIVYAFDATYVYTIEGNAAGNTHSINGDGVYLKKHARRAARIQGYGYPRFTEGIKSADPKPPVPQRKTTPTTPPKKGSTVADVPNFEARMIESNTRIEEMLRAIGAKVGADIKGALARAEKTNKSRK